jgi:hypothetical protein
MFTFLKKIFFKEEQPKQEKKLMLKEVEQLILEKEKDELGKLKQRLVECEHKFREVKDELEQHLNELEKATLQNTNIPAKAFHFMEGNRESYIRFVRQFLSAVSELPKEAKDIEAYCTKFTQQLNHFAVVSRRNYFVLQNFFANTLRDIGRGLKLLEEQVKNLHDDFKASKIKHVEDIKNGFARFNSKREYKKKLEQDILSAEMSLQSSSKHAAQEKERLISFEQGEEWTQRKAQAQQLAVAKEAAKAEEQKIRMLFSPLEKAFKKYAKEAFDSQQLTERYGEDSASALEHDSELHIVGILEKLGRSLGKTGLGLDEKRIQKANSALDNLTRETLLEHRKTLTNIRQKIVQVEQEISSSEVQHQHENHQKALQAAEDDRERKKHTVEMLKSKIEGIDEKQMLRELELSIGEKLGEHVSIGEEAK